MLDFSHPHHFRKTVAGIAMILGPALALASFIVGLAPERDEAAMVAAVAGDPDAFYLGTLLGLAALVCLVPAVLGLMHMLRERQASAGHLGGGLALLGLMLLTAWTGAQLVLWQAGSGGDPAQMAALFERVNETAGSAIPFVAAPFAYAIGIAVVALGLWRADAVDAWVAGALVLSAALYLAGVLATSEALLIAAGAVFLGGMATIGRMVLAESDEAWEHTPMRHAAAGAA